MDSTTAIPALRGHALRLKLDTGHLDAYRSDHCTDGRIEPHIENLDRAGTLLAAAWFTLCGLEVSWPLEPSRYDLIVVSATRVRRVQVKTTTVRAGRSWKVYLSTTAGGRKPYGPDEIDEFFIVTGDLTYYLIPFEAVGGLHAIHLSAYTQYRMVAA
ncbi:group I intron-associated PD-(D/E)XK endonuclease [Gordonia iterans]